MDAIGVHTDRQITKSKAQELFAVEEQCMAGEEYSCVSGTGLFPSHTLSQALFCLPVHPTKWMSTLCLSQQENGAQGPLMPGILGAPIPTSVAASVN